ncbi:MAG: phytase [Candidatus Flexifilum sp.]
MGIHRITPLFAVLSLIALAFTGSASAQEWAVVSVPALAETAPTPGDGSVTAVIWAHPTDLSQSVIIGSDDNSGVGVYALDGTEIQFITADDIGGVDLRYNFPRDDERITLVLGSVKDAPEVVAWTIDPTTRTLTEIGRIPVGFPTAGLCMYHSGRTGAYYVFVTGEDGPVEQYRLEWTEAGLSATLARAFNVGGEIELCAADDALARLYFGEEGNALWRYGAEPEQGIQRAIVDAVATPNLPGRITEQVEGVALIPGQGSAGYLIASNEQNNSFLVYERAGDNRFIGEFRVDGGALGDAVTEPNGFGALPLPLGDAYPQGVFVTADETNSNPGARNNFKIVSLADILTALDLPLDTVWVDPRARRDVVQTGGAVLIAADAETAPVPSGVDAADDPAIWIHPTDPALSLIIGTEKTTDGGLVAYNLDGSIHQTVVIGRVNNVDLRYGFPLNGVPTDILTATNRTLNSLAIYAVDAQTRTLSSVAADTYISDMREVYGICMYRSARTGDYYAFMNSANTGEVEQYRLIDAGNGQIAAELVREFVVGSQTEGCTADDEAGVLYIGEEDVGIWRYGAEPDAGDARVLVDAVGDVLTADVEGMALYTAANGAGYLIVSAQGASEFVVYDRAVPADGSANAYVGTFAIIESDATDAVSGSDGLDVTNFGLGDRYPDGLFVTQDDLNLNPPANQNFKLVSWRTIADALGLIVDPTFDPRSIGR